MIHIPDILAPAQVMLNVEATTLSEVIGRLGEQLKRHPAISDWDAFLEALNANREISQTALGNGLCIPHARGNFASEMVMAAARLGTPIEAQDESGPIQQVFLICVPQAMSADHLRVVGALARVFNDEDAVSDLLVAEDAGSYLKRLRKAELKLS